MPRLILLAAVVITVFILVKRAQAQPPHKRRAAYLQLLFGGAAIIAIMRTLAGKMHWLGAALTGIVVALRQSLPLLIRAFPLLNQWFQQRQAQAQGQRSEVRSKVLRMTLDHTNGELDGEVIDGEFRGWYLAEMTRSQLDTLMAHCRHADDDSVQLLSAYFEQRFPDDFQDSMQGNPEPAPGDLSRSEALAVLGLSEDASDEDIVQAHRSLIQKLHPDRGGNDYLAAKINEAKDFLLRD